MRLKLAATIILFIISSKVYAQDEKLFTSLKKLIQFNEVELKSNPNYQNKSFMFFFGIGVDKNGKVDTVIYNKRNLLYARDPLRELLNLPHIATQFKNNTKDLTPYKNQFVILLIYLHIGEDTDLIKNAKDIDYNWENLTSEMAKIKKKITLLTPMLYYHVGKGSRN